MGNEDADRTGKQATYGSVAPKAQRDILVHSVLAGLTPLIPLPWVDDWAREGIQTRMVRAIAKAHGASLYDADARALGKEAGPKGSMLYSVAKKLAFLPIKKLFRKALFVLVVKDMMEVASQTYHVGYLLDFAFGQGWQGTHAPEKLREAVDAVCKRADTSPVRRAFASVFEESRELLGAAVEAARSWMGSKAEDRDEEHPKEVEALVDRLVRVVNVLPPEHFEGLRADLRATLGVPTP